jgi:O-antigen/teichoic acid export membrane protein
MTYADKLLIYPVLGGYMVSVYFASTLFGKIVALSIAPINSVALTYLSRLNKERRHSFSCVMGLGAGICMIGYAVCIFISEPVLAFFYPSVVDEAMKLIYITTANMALQTLIAIADPFILKFYDMKWQLLLNGGTTVIYVLLSLILLNQFGLVGFCFGTMATSASKLIAIFGLHVGVKTKTSKQFTSRL